MTLCHMYDIHVILSALFKIIVCLIDSMKVCKRHSEYMTKAEITTIKNCEYCRLENMF